MDIREFMDRLNQAAGSTEYGEIMRSIDPNLNAGYESAVRRNMRRNAERAAKDMALQRQREHDVNIWTQFNSRHGLPLMLGTITEVIPTFQEEHQTIIVYDENKYNGINVIWRCDPEVEEIRDIFQNINPNSDKIDIDWDTFKEILIEVMTEDIWDLCKKGFDVKKQNTDENIYVKPSYAMGMAHFVLCNVFKKSYTKCYNADNGIKDGCFITTAVCDNFGKADDCYELKTFRHFRDNWLVNQIDGEKLIQQYYSIAPQIVKNINECANAKKIYQSIWIDYLKPCLSLIEQNKFSDCKNKYIEMVQNLKKIYF